MENDQSAFGAYIQKGTYRRCPVCQGLNLYMAGKPNCFAKEDSKMYFRRVECHTCGLTSGWYTSAEEIKEVWNNRLDQRDEMPRCPHCFNWDTDIVQLKPYDKWYGYCNSCHKHTGAWDCEDDARMRFELGEFVSLNEFIPQK